MKTVLFLIVAAVVVIVLLQFWSWNDFVEPWKAWANYIGYFK